jgi:hypothetical protein
LHAFCSCGTAVFDLFKLGMLVTAISQFNVNSGERAVRASNSSSCSVRAASWHLAAMWL